MRYYVLAPTGERYGPADVQTLSQWAADGRVSPASQLMEEMSGMVVVASSVPGLTFPQAAPPPYASSAPPPPGMPYQAPSAPYQPLPPGQAYTRPGYAFSPKITGANPTNDLLLSFGMVLVSPILSLFCTFGFTTALVGIAAGWRAFQNGRKIAILPIVLNVCALVFWALSRYVFRWWWFNRYY